VVRLEDVFEDKENVYIIMELCPNQTNLELVKCKKRFIESDARRYMLQVLSSSYAPAQYHSQGSEAR
jgi:serine/threonine protein kinase